MSQIDQAFIKAYHQHTAPDRDAQTADASTTHARRDGTQIRLDVPGGHLPAKGGSRVPTPHLQVALGKAAWLAERAAKAAVASEQVDTRVPQQQVAQELQAPAPPKKKLTFSSPSLWSPTSRLGQRHRASASQSVEQQTPPPSETSPAKEVSPPPSHGRFISIEETLLRLDGPVADHVAQREDISAEAATVTQPKEELANTLKMVGLPPEVEITAPTTTTPVGEETPSNDISEVALVETTQVEEAPVAEEPETVEPPASVAAEAAVAESLVAAPPAPFQAVWEVDAFQWPEVTDRLQTDATEELTAACQSLASGVSPDANLLAVTGIDENAGATTLTLTLARGLAQQGLKVAIVDADFDRPMLAERLGVRVQDGWEAALNGKLPLEEVCISSLGDGVTLVPLTAGTDMSAIKASLIAASVMQRLASEFDIVLIDAGSGSENVAAVATSSDGVLDVAVLLAVDQRKQDQGETSEMISRLKQCALGSIQMAQTFVNA